MSDDRTPDPTEEPVRPEREVAAELRLRPEGPRVVRLSRKILGLLAGVSAVALGGALIFALQSSRPQATAELFNTDNPNQAEGLTRLPGDYATVPRQVPQLGPPLPGDLGRPMLNAGVQPPPLPGAPLPAPPATTPTQPNLEAQRLAQERQRIAQEREAARSSRLFAAEARSRPSAGQPVSAGEAAELGGGSASSLAQVSSSTGDDPQSRQTRGERRQTFRDGGADRKTASSDRVQAPASPHVVQAGAVIAAAMITGLRSDLPGQVTAQVTEHVYDGPTGTTLLIPQGSRLIGQYDAQIAFGQSRALLLWNRIIFPNGRSIVLEREPAADATGYAGLQDGIDNHWGQIMRAALVSTLLSVGTEAGSKEGESELLRAIRRGSSDSVSQTGRQIVGRSLDVQPTLTIRPGFPVRVVVTRDLVLEPYQG